MGLRGSHAMQGAQASRAKWTWDQVLIRRFVVIA